MKTLRSKFQTVLKVSLVLILLGFFGKKSKAEVPADTAVQTIEVSK